MKMVLTILAWIFAMGALLMAYLFMSNYQIAASDLELSGGELTANPEVLRDEYDNYNTKVSLLLRNEDKPVVIPGKLLALAEEAILQLKAGDKIQFYEKKNTAYQLFDKDRRLAFGIGTEEQFFYTKEQALSFYRSPKMLGYAALFLILGVLVIFLLIKN